MRQNRLSRYRNCSYIREYKLHNLQQLKSDDPEDLQDAQYQNSVLTLQMQQHYFQTMDFVQLTHNFNVDVIKDQAEVDQYDISSVVDEQNDEGFVTAIELPEVSFVGNIFKIQDFKPCPEEEMKIMTFRSSYDNKDKLILVHTTEYKSYYVKHTNRMIKNKTDKYIITRLHPLLYLHGRSSLEDKIYYQVQDTSQLFQINDHFYFGFLRPIEKITNHDFKFANLSFAKIYNEDQLDRECKDGIILAQIKQRFQAKQKENISIAGIVSSLEISEDKSKFRKQMILYMTQILYHYPLYTEKSKFRDQGIIKCNEIGRCKVIIHYSPEDKDYIEGLIKVNCPYLITDLDIKISQTAAIWFMTNIPKDQARNACIFRIGTTCYEGINFGGDVLKNSTPFKLAELEEVLKIKLLTTPISRFLEKSINRNIVRLEVSIRQIQIIFGSIRCPRCNIEIKRNEDRDWKACQMLGKFTQNQEDPDIKQLFCRGEHKSLHCLQLWGMVRAADHSGTCMLSMEHRELIRFLELQPHYQALQKAVIENGKGMALITSNRSKLKREQDPLFVVRLKLKRAYIEKAVVGFSKTELEKTFREGLTEQEQLEYQASLHNTKKYMQQKKIFPNGTIERRGDQVQLLPVIKVLDVQDFGDAENELNW